MKPSGSRLFAFRLIMIAAGVSFAFLIAEVALRLIPEPAAHEAHQSEELDVLQPNPNGTGSFRLKPNLSLTTRVRNYDVAIKTNSHGMPWREVSQKKRDRRRRIAFVGDSFTFGCWARSVEESFAGVFEQFVAPDRWEVMNFGVGGYGIADIELLIEEVVLDFEPDFIIVASFNGNDFRDTYLGVHKEHIEHGVAILDEELMERRVPAAFRQADRTTSPPSAETGRLAMLRHSEVFKVLAPWLNLEHLAVEFRVSQRFLSYSFWSQHPYPAPANEAKDLTLETLERLRTTLDERGIRLAIATIPTREQVYARSSVGENFDVAYPQAHIQHFSRERDIAFIDLLPIFREHVAATNENLYVRGDTHWNNAGHALAGWHLSEWFRCCVKAPPRSHVPPY